MRRNPFDLDGVVVSTLSEEKKLKQLALVGK